jgi:flagellar basal body-associated protein FliL
MADKPTSETPDAPPAKSGGGLKTVIAIVAVLLLEGLTVGVMLFMTGGPKPVEGVELQPDQTADANKMAELLLIKDKFPNFQTGRHFLYDFEAYITVKASDNAGDALKTRLDSMKAQVQMEIATIVRSAHPSYFEEPTLATLRRQVKAVLDTRLTDPDGKSLVQDLLITRCIPFRVDF